MCSLWLFVMSVLVKAGFVFTSRHFGERCRHCYSQGFRRHLPEEKELKYEVILMEKEKTTSPSRTVIGRVNARIEGSDTRAWL